VTIEGIAAAAGVAKQTIYRWWNSKTDILMDALLQDAAQHLGSAVDTGVAGDAVGALVADQAGQLLDGRAEGGSGPFEGGDVRRQEPRAAPAMLFLLALVVAVGRFVHWS